MIDVEQELLSIEIDFDAIGAKAPGQHLFFQYSNKVIELDVALLNRAFE